MKRILVTLPAILALLLVPLGASAAQPPSAPASGPAAPFQPPFPFVPDGGYPVAKTPSAPQQLFNFHVYVPFIAGGSGASSTLYDDFSTAGYNGSFNPFLWQFGGAGYQAQQGSGVMVFTNPPTTAPSTGARLRMITPSLRTWKQLGLFQADLKISNVTGGWNSLQISATSDTINGHSWFMQCYMGAPGGNVTGLPEVGCDITTTATNGTVTTEYQTVPVVVQFNQFHTVKIVTDPNTAAIQFYMDNNLIGSHTPLDAAAVAAATNFQPEISVYTQLAGGSSVRTFDNVYVTPAH